ncbi:MAG: cation-transporting P-type ATPase, partial [Candidatus Rokubacteria bacterium]|nr:cation-transporting P-type ATPase [Candidatus Rokubacteria bacterium]
MASSPPRPRALSPFLAGDPVRLGPDIGAAGDLVERLALGAPDAWGLLPLAPGVALLHALGGGSGRLQLQWIELPHAPTLAAETPPAEVVVVLSGPLAEAAAALRLVGRLRACFGAPGFADRARTARTREELVTALAATEAAAGEGRLAASEVLAILRSTPAGLAAVEAASRQAACGPNRLERVRRRSLAARFLEQFRSFFAILLWIGGACAFLAEMPELGWAIFAVIVVNGVFSFFQEYRAERAVEVLEELLPRRIAVLRPSGELPVPTADLVPGDVVRLDEGTQVPADGQILAAADLRVDQSALTGESQPVVKRPARDDETEAIPPLERSERVFAGTSIMSGSGTFVVTTTGMATEIGAIAHLTQAVPEEPSPLHREMVRVTRVVTLLAVGFGAGFFALGFLTGTLRVQEALVFALGVIVANVPEGLLPTLTLALALGVQRMARQGSL